VDYCCCYWWSYFLSSSSSCAGQWQSTFGKSQNDYCCWIVVPNLTFSFSYLAYEYNYFVSCAVSEHRRSQGVQWVHLHPPRAVKKISRSSSLSRLSGQGQGHRSKKRVYVCPARALHFWPKQLVLSMHVRSLNIYVKFIYQCYRVKVKPQGHISTKACLCILFAFDWRVILFLRVRQQSRQYSKEKYVWYSVTVLTATNLSLITFVWR